MLEALAKFCESIKRYAGSLGKSNLYHETITFAYIFLIHERIQMCEESQSWDEFALLNGDLLNGKDGLLKSYYSEDILKSDRARKMFVFPDRLPQPASENAAAAIPGFLLRDSLTEVFK
jgi:hypothetical protein